MDAEIVQTLGAERQGYLAYVRPGPNALTWLRGAVADLQGQSPLRPVSILVPNRFTGHLVLGHLARADGYVNVRAMRLGQAIATVARPSGVPGRAILQPVLEESAVRAALRLCAGPFQAIDHRSLQQALIGLFRELRRAEIDDSTLATSTNNPTTQAAIALYREFQRQTQRYDNPTHLANRATDTLNQSPGLPRELASLGALILFLPPRLDPAEARFLAAASRWTPLIAVFSEVGDPSGLGNRESIRSASLLTRALDVSPLPEPESPQSLALLATIRVLRAPDPAEEVREVVRSIAADLEAGVPLYQTAILYRRVEPYGVLVRESLAAAGLPWASSEGQRLPQSRPGRCLLALLRLVDRNFTRDAVMEWLETVPDDHQPLPGVSPANWDRLCRAASVIRGANQWTERLTSYATSLESSLSHLSAEAEEDTPPAALIAKRRQVADARAIAAFVATLATALVAPTDGSRWAEFVDWVTKILQVYVGQADDWPTSERTAVKVINLAIESLRQADEIETERGPTAVGFRVALETALEAERLETGRFSEGILVEPLAAVTGLTFQRVYVLGMVEGAFPTPPGGDPFFPSGSQDPLDRANRHRAKDRQDFLVALAAGDDGVVTLSVPDSDGARAAFPSRWLLDIASGLAGEELDTERFSQLSPSNYRWLRIVHSAQDGVQGGVARADLEDRRLHDAARWRAQSRLLAQHPLARRTDLPLGRALQLAEARRSRQLTEFDGNLSALATTSRRLTGLLDGSSIVSASAVQSWASCGFRYFLERVVRVEPTPAPEDLWTLTPLDRGSLIHAILEGFFRTLDQQGRPRLDEPYGVADHTSIQNLARQHFARFAQAGATGHPLAWENAQRTILADLRVFLAVDAAWRAEQRLLPRFFEQAFGIPARESGQSSWPALRVRFGDRSIRFRGFVDRIDLDLQGGRAFVFDYKTGTGNDYADLDKDPVAAGQHVQLALYSRAVRQNLTGVSDVDGAFWFITSRGEFKRQGTTGDRESIDRRLDEVLAIVARGIQGGAFPQIPGGPHHLGGFVNCAFCDFTRICPARRDTLQERKREHPLAALHGTLALAANADPPGEGDPT